MTAPISHGYPDWGRFAAQADILLNIETGTVINNPVTRGPYFVGNVQAVGIEFSPSVGSAEVQIGWYDSAAGTNLLTLETYEFQVGTRMTQTIPVLGPFMLVTIVDGVSPCTFSLTLWTAPTRRNKANGATGISLVGVINTAIGIGVTATNNATEVHIGEVYWSGWQGVANFVAFLEVVDSLGNVTILDRWQGAGLEFSRRIFLPAARARIRHVNQSGANTVYNSVLLKSPYVVGS